MWLFKKLRTYYWIIQKFLDRHHKVIAITTLTTLVLTTLIYLFIKYIPITPTKKTRIARVGKFTTASIPQDIKQQVSYGLVKMDVKGNTKPGIAKSWTISSDGKKYTFKLNDLEWHDGNTLKPQDIKLSFKEVETEYKDNSVIFNLKEPFSPFLSILSKPILKDGRYGVGKQKKITKIKTIKGVIQSITLSGDNQNIIYKFYPTENTAITAFKLGEVDKIEKLSYIPEDIKTEPRVNISEQTNYNKITAIFFNNKDSNLASKPLRQALAYAIPNKGFGYERAISPIPKNSWAFNPNVKKYEYNIEHAKKLFNDNIKEPENIKIEIKTMLRYLDIAEKIAQSWKDAFNIQVDVKVSTDFTNDYQAILVDFAPSIDPDQYTMWHSTQSTNFTHYQNLKIDKLLEDGRKTTNKKLRKEIYQDFQRFLLEDSPAIFLFYPTEYTITRKSIIH